VVDIEGRQHLVHHLDVILVRVAQDQMIEGGHSGPDSLQVGQHPIPGAAARIVLAAGVVEQGEVGALDEDGEAGSDVDRVDHEGAGGRMRDGGRGESRCRQGRSPERAVLHRESPRAEAAPPAGEGSKGGSSEMGYSPVPGRRF
jgi:hypothetical protein